MIARGQRGMVVSGHHAASLAGVRTLESGGNVVDAMVATSAVLTVVLGHATSIGGDCFLLFHDAASGRTTGLNASGCAPAAASPERFAGGMAGHGPLAATVPGLVRAWEAMHARFGSLPWRGLFDPALALAQGHDISRMLAKSIPAYREALLADPACAALYFSRGEALAAGTTLRQPALGATLETIAAKGAASFYEGALARQIAAFFSRRGGLIGAADLAAFRAEWVEPAGTTYREHRVLVMPPNSYGVLLLMQLNGLSALPSEVLRTDPLRRVAGQMSAMKAAFSHGVAQIGDPAAAAGAVERLTGEPMAAAMRAAVSGTAPQQRVPNAGGTSCILIADAKGNAISLVQSVFHPFGSACLDPATGILFNNRMLGFAHRPGQVNSVGPRKRPAHTLCPILVAREGRVRFALASPGGLSQTLTNAQVLTHLLDGGADVEAAVSRPRWCNTLDGDFLAEPEFTESFVSGLAALGHPTVRRPDPYYYGSAKAIELLPTGMLAGAADHRREAFAAGY